jgi:hypothetical protein
MAHTYNPSYSGGRDQEDHSLKPGQIVCETLSRKTPSQKRAGVAPEVKPQYRKKNKDDNAPCSWEAQTKGGPSLS